jgi:hypothetical protein
MKQLRATSAAAGGLDEAGVSARAHQPSVSSGHVQERQVLGQRAGVAHGLLRDPPPSSSGTMPTAKSSTNSSFIRHVITTNYVTVQYDPA